MTSQRLLGALLALGLTLFVWAGAAGAQDSVADGSSSSDSSMVDETPIPVEPDGGIGDGATPLPTDNGLAVTGSNSLAIAFIGAGMIIVGATTWAAAQRQRMPYN